MEIIRIDENFSRWTELLQTILVSFAYMNGRIDPPSSCSQIGTASSGNIRLEREMADISASPDFGLFQQYRPIVDPRERRKVTPFISARLNPSRYDPY